MRRSDIGRGGGSVLTSVGSTRQATRPVAVASQVALGERQGRGEGVPNDRLVRRTAKMSIAAQLVIGLASGAAVFASPSAALSRILILETVSQFVELVWYVVTLLRTARVRSWTRYLDWAVSTPTMLVSTALFFRLRSGGQGTLGDDGMVLMLGFNWLMLAFGLAAEAATMPRDVALVLGSGSFVAAFSLLSTFLPSSDDGGVCLTLFVVMYAVWGLYGCAAVLDETSRNVAYNLLDVVSKNFYGLFLAVYALDL